MFSEMIQSLLNSGGKSAAMQRTAQINNYMRSVDRQIQAQNSAQKPLDTIYPPGANNVQSFEKILSSTTQSNFGSLLLNPKSLNVNGNIYDGSDDISTDNFTNKAILNAIQEVNDARRDYSKPAVSSSKSQLLSMINQVANRHGVDEKLVKPLLSKNPDLIQKRNQKLAQWA